MISAELARIATRPVQGVKPRGSLCVDDDAVTIRYRMDTALFQVLDVWARIPADLPAAHERGVTSISRYALAASDGALSVEWRQPDSETEYPQPADAAPWWSGSAARVRRMLAYASPSAQSGGVVARPALSWLHCDGGHMRCTDSYRLVCWPWTADTGADTPMWPWALWAALHTGGGRVRVMARPGRMHIESPLAEVAAVWDPDTLSLPSLRRFSRIMDGAAEPSWSADAAALRAAARALGTGAVSHARLDGSGVTLLGRAGALAAGVPAAAPIGDAPSAEFGYRYLLEALQHAGPGALLACTDEGKPGKTPWVVSGSGDCRTLLMPAIRA